MCVDGTNRVYVMIAPAAWGLDPAILQAWPLACRIYELVIAAPLMSQAGALAPES